jgi:PAS domain S-box-containing protein
MSLVAWISYQQAVESLTRVAGENLEQATVAKVTYIQNWFEYRSMDIEHQAQNPRTVNLLQRLIEGFKNSGKTAEEYVKSADWRVKIEEDQQSLEAMRRSYDYVYDILLIDNQGNILYTLVREADLGGNLFSGALASSRFAQSVYLTLQSGQTTFSDFQIDASSNSFMAGFLVAPVYDASNGVIGALSIRISLEQLFDRIASPDRSERSMVHYLAGEDGLIRTTFNGNQASWNHSIKSQHFKHWLSEHVNMGQWSNESKEHTLSFERPDGKIVLGAHRTVNLPGNVNWVLISEVDRNEALAAVDWLASATWVLVLLTGIVAVGMGINLARYITLPIKQLADTSMAVSAGELDQRVEVTGGHEIRRLAEAFNHMLAVRQNHEKALEKSNQEIRSALVDLAEQKFALDQHAIVSITDRDGNLTFVNDKFCAITGYSRDQLLGHNHRIINSNFHDTEFFSNMYQLIHSGAVWHGEVRNLTKGGDVFWLDTTIVPFMGDDEKPQSFIAIRSDITARKHAEQELKKSMHNLERLNRLMSDRELRIIELKREFNELQQSQGLSAKYQSVTK